KNQGTSTSNVVNNSAKDAIVEQNANRRMGVNPSSYTIQDASKSGNELAKEAQGLFEAIGANNAHNNDAVANQNSLNNLGTAGGNNIRNEFSQQSGATISNF
ncbi:TPA: hypothetical protein SB332_001998, partial [Campylobacter coli]|nr:hypothetical protein [Campylobacter coli]HEG0330118.1 hypothetical protein [Campylobacter coli]